MKRLRSVLLIVCVMFVFSGVTVMATNLEPRADNYASAAANISISGGTAKVSAAITGKIGITTKTSIQMYLQKYTNQKWVNVDSWSSSGNTVTRSITKNKSVTKGYKYRTKAVCVAYAGSSKETVTKYSSAVSY